MNGGRSHENAGELNYRGVKVNAKWKKTGCERKSEIESSSRDLIDIKEQFTQKYKFSSSFHAGRKLGEVL